VKTAEFHVRLEGTMLEFVFSFTRTLVQSQCCKNRVMKRGREGRSAV